MMSVSKGALGIRLSRESHRATPKRQTFLCVWRRERDSNPRYTFLGVCSLSRGVPSTTRPSLRVNPAILPQGRARGAPPAVLDRSSDRFRRLVELEGVMELSHGEL